MDKTDQEPILTQTTRRHGVGLSSHCKETTTLPNQLYSAADTTRTLKHLQKRPRVSKWVRWIQVQLEEDGCCSSGQNWMEKNGLWPMLL